MQTIPTLGQIREEVLGFLKADHRFEGVKLLGEYPGNHRELPVKETTITVGLERVELSSAALGGYLGEAVTVAHGRQALGGPLADITLRFDCYRPQGEAFSEHFIESLYDCLLPVTGLTKIWCEPIRPETKALANHLRILATVQVLLAGRSETHVYEQIILKRRNTDNANI
jgi:hypothetical protein